MKKEIEHLVMALRDKVWVTIEGTVQPAQFEPIKIVMGQSRTIGPDDDPDKIRMQICQRILQDVIQEGENARNKTKSSDQSTEISTERPIRKRRNL